MKKYLSFSTVVVALFILACDTPMNSFLINVSSQTDCDSKNGYWYNEKCWNDYKDNGIKAQDIDKIVEEQMKQINEAKITYAGKVYPILGLDISPEGKEVVVLLKFIDNQNTIFMKMNLDDLEKGRPTDVQASYIIGNLEELTDKTIADKIVAQGILRGVPLSGKLEYKFFGNMTNTKDRKVLPLEFIFSEALTGAGSSTLVVKGNEAYLNGDLGTRTYSQMKDLIKNHPEVKTIVSGEISGSVNDAVNMHTGRILNQAGLNTKVLSTSRIASGGVDLFCAGKERIVEKGAKIGIHSWCCVGEKTASEISKDHPAHKYQIEYFTMCLGKEKGTDFYFHTLTAAPFDDIHIMSDADIKKWQVATKFID